MKIISKLTIVFICLCSFQNFTFAAMETETEFDRALKSGNVVVLKELLEAGADPNQRYHGKGLSAINMAASNPWETMFADHMGAEQTKKIDENAVAKLEALFAHGAKIMPYEKDILVGPAMYGLTQTLEYLIAKGADVNGAEVSGDTPLALAYIYDRRGAIKILLEHGAEKIPRDQILQLKVINAIGAGDLGAVKQLIKQGASVNEKTPSGQAPLHEACSGCEPQIVEWLLKNGAAPNAYAKSPIFYTPAPALWHAVLLSRGVTSDCHKPIVKLLLNQGALVSAQDKIFGKTALHVAAKNNNVWATKMLLDKGAKVMMKDNYGKTPLDYAEGGEVIKMLKKAGAVESI